MADADTKIAFDVKNKDFWQECFPRLHIASLLSEGFQRSVIEAPQPVTTPLNNERLKVDGYFQDRDDTLVQLAPVLGEAATTLKQMGVSPLFLFLFDEAWLCFHALHKHISAVLGDYRILPAFWVWHVNPFSSEAGWPPHRDKGKHSLDENGNPLAVTAWIALSEASPLSSCMYILPKSRDPVYGTDHENDWQIDFSSIRALPASPGDFFFWDQSVLHWGSTGSPYAAGPRISMALEFQRSDRDPFVKPLMPPFANPDFDVRLWLISKSIREHNEVYSG
jgi:Phytanoyl-CoA dioxygenase (PhyH)